MPTLHVVDYKHGVGVPVEADTPQGRYYGLGALLDLGLDREENLSEVFVKVTIVQPRCPHPDGPVRSVTYTAQELLAWGNSDVRVSVAAAKDPEAELIPSEKACRFCKAKVKCPALQQQSLEQAGLEFEDDGKVAPLKPMDELSADAIARIIANEKAIKAWVDGVKEMATNCLRYGDDVTDGAYKLVRGRSSRKWDNETEAASILKELGYSDDDIYTTKLATPAQAEKLVGKEQKNALADLIVKEEGGVTLAPADDKRPAVNAGAEADFA